MTSSFYPNNHPISYIPMLFTYLPQTLANHIGVESFIWVAFKLFENFHVQKTKKNREIAKWIKRIQMGLELEKKDSAPM